MTKVLSRQRFYGWIPIVALGPTMLTTPSWSFKVFCFAIEMTCLTVIMQPWLEAERRDL